MGGIAAPIVGGLLGLGGTVYASNRAERAQRSAMEDARRRQELARRQMEEENRRLEEEALGRAKKLKQEQTKLQEATKAKKDLEAERLSRLQARAYRGKRNRSALFASLFDENDAL